VGFLNPVNLLYAGSIAVLVAIYFRSRARPTIEVSSLMLFEQAAAPVSRVRTLRTDLLFWLEVAALALIVLGLAGPYVEGPPAVFAGRSHVLVFDLGAAMGARQGGKTRLDLAKAEAVHLVDSAPSGEDFTVLGYGLDAHVVRSDLSARPALVAAIEALRPMAVAGTPDALSAALMRAQTAGRIDVFADRPIPSAVLAQAALGDRIHFHQVGAPAGNLAIVSLDPGVPRVSPGHVTVKSFYPLTHECELAIEADRKIVFDRALLLGPGEQATVPFGPLAAGGLVHARILTPDPLAADNDRWALAPLNKADPVLVVSPDRTVRDDLARILLAVNRNFIVTAISPADFRRSVEGAKRYSLTVMHDCFVAGVKTDSLLLVYPPAMKPVPGGPLAGFAVASALKPVRMLASGASNAGLELDSARVAKLPDWMARTISGEMPGARVTFPLAAVGMIPQGRFGLLAFDVRRHLLLDPDKLDALVATINLVRELTSAADVRVVSTGAYLDIPAGKSARVVDPMGHIKELAADRWGRVRMRPMLAGHYTVSSGLGAVNVYANYYNASESDLSARPAAETVETAGAPAPAPVGAPREVRPLATVLVALALVALIAESVVLLGHARRWRAWNV
jgi:hypothetical protein